MSKKVIFIGMFLSLIGATAFIKIYSTHKPYQKIEFSDTLYSQEREIARAKFREELQDSKRVMGFDDVTIKIAKYDLNHDGIQDVFVMLQGRAFCGSQGCWTGIYIVDKNEKWHEAYLFNTHGLFGVSHRKHAGYFDLVQIGSAKDHPTSECFLLKYEWENGRYEGVGYQELTKKDEEAIGNENL